MKSISLIAMALLLAAPAHAQAASTDTILGCDSSQDFYGSIKQIHKFDGSGGWQIWDSSGGQWFDACEDNATCSITPGYYERTVRMNSAGLLVFKIDRQTGGIKLDVYGSRDIYTFYGQCQKTAAPVPPKPNF